MRTISKKTAGRFMLAYHHLDRPRKIRGDAAILDYIRKVGAIQYDPLNKAGRNADLVLQSRFKGYRESVLYRLLYEERKLIDGWDKCMCIWPVEHWPFFARYRREAATWNYNHRDDLEPVRKKIVSEIRVRSFVSSKEIAEDRKIDWWWAPTDAGRAVLESMYHAGELVIHHKQGTRKYYSLAEDTLPPEVYTAADPHPTDDEYDRWHVLRRISSAGLVQDRNTDLWVGCPVKGVRRRAALDSLTGNALLPLNIEGVPGRRFFIPAEQEPLLDSCAATRYRKEVSFLAPLDNFLWDRDLVEQLFGFEYRWEVYTPASKRQYGYYVLPVLYGDVFAGRIEPVMDKKKKTLSIANWWPEAGFTADDRFVEAADRCLADFATFLGCESTGANPWRN